MFSLPCSVYHVQLNVFSYHVHPGKTGGRLICILCWLNGQIFPLIWKIQHGCRQQPIRKLCFSCIMENLSAEMHMDLKISRVCLLVCLLSSQGDVQVFIFSSSSFFLACSSSFPIIICYHLLQYFTGFSLICCAFSTGAEPCSHALW